MILRLLLLLLALLAGSTPPGAVLSATSTTPREWGQAAGSAPTPGAPNTLAGGAASLLAGNGVLGDVGLTEPAGIAVQGRSDATHMPPSSASLSGPVMWRPQAGAAAGPALQAFLGRDWRGSAVLVHGPAGSAVVWLVDTTAAALVDLPESAFVAVCGPLSIGVCRASVSRVPAPPVTSTGP